MVLLESVKVELGSEMPAFNLKDCFSEEHVGKEMIGDKGLLVVFSCNHCPYAQAVWERVVKIAKQFRSLGVETVAINPNINPDYPEDNVDGMKKLVNMLGIDFPYLVDETQEVAKAFDAQCTPDIYLYDSQGRLVYHGRIDDNWRDEHDVKNHELQTAMNAMVNGLKVSKDQKPAMGCSIKWKD